MLEKCLNSPGAIMTTPNGDPAPKKLEPDAFASSFVKVDIEDAKAGSYGPAGFAPKPAKCDMSKSLGFSLQGLTVVEKRNLKIGASVWCTAMILGLSLGCTLLPQAWPPDNLHPGPSPRGAFGILYGIIVGVGGLAIMGSYVAQATHRST